MTQDEALQVLMTGANVFLTGEPGSGKTYTVDRYVRWLRAHGIEPAVTASTGIAATHIGGMTIHSWSGIGAREWLSEYDVEAIGENKNVRRRTRSTNVLIIDEVSMLSGDTLGMVDSVLRAARERSQPFGGMQVVVVGDFFQLPPVVRARRSEYVIDDGEEQGVFAFQSRAWRELSPFVCYLEEQHRQSDGAFLSLLAQVRRAENLDIAAHALLARRTEDAKAPPHAPRLFSHNRDVDTLNDARLGSVSGKLYTYTMQARGPESFVLSLKRGCLSPEVLRLKLGARVMFTKNDSVRRRFVNGTLGEVVQCAQDGTPTVRTTDGALIAVEPAEWTMEDGGRILARISQLPLRLAWAITVHKSQGMTLDEAVVDLSGAFEYGQGYVALSRVRSLAGLHVVGHNLRALQVHPDVRAHDARFKEASQDARERFASMNEREHREFVERFVLASGGKPEGGVTEAKKPRVQKAHKGDTYLRTLELVRRGMSLREIAKERGVTAGTVVSHLEQLYLQGKIAQPEVRRMVPGPLLRALPKVAPVFATMGTERLAPVHQRLRGVYSFDDLRIMRLLLLRA